MNTYDFGRQAAGWTRTLSVGAAALALAALGVLGAVSATHAAELQRATVDYRDLDLSKQKDVTALYQRVNNAARQVCAVVDSKRLSAKAKFDECKAQAVQSALQDIGSPVLIRYHNARGGAGSSNLVLSAR